MLNLTISFMECVSLQLPLGWAVNQLPFILSVMSSCEKSNRLKLMFQFLRQSLVSWLKSAMKRSSKRKCLLAWMTKESSIGRNWECSSKVILGKECFTEELIKRHLRFTNIRCSLHLESLIIIRDTTQERILIICYTCQLTGQLNPLLKTIKCLQSSKITLTQE